MKRIIEKLIHLAGVMEMPPFPCFMVDISTRQDDLIGDFLTERPSQNWLMLADYAALTDHQLWTAWLFSQRAFAKGKALARSIDAEFLRYIAGTHHVSEAFKKVGIQKSHDKAWIVYLPDYEENEGELYPLIDLVQSKEISVKIAEKLGIQPIESRPEITLDGLNKLGIAITKLDDITDDLIIGFVISSDLNS
jgi:tRNA threonylcarbamoyladenosine modification (KEOPS) complex Cgi121 subunit